MGQKKCGSKKICVKKKFRSKKFGSKKFGSTFLLLHESYSWVRIGLHAENQLLGWSGSGLKLFRWVVVGGGGGLHTHNLVKPTLLVMVELGFDNKSIYPSIYLPSRPTIRAEKNQLPGTT